MQSNTTTPETSNPAIERWKKMPRTPEQYETIKAFLEEKAPSFKKFVTTQAQKALLSLGEAGRLAKEMLDLIVIFGEGTNETLAEALSIERVMCASDPETRQLADPTMLEILGADINPDLFAYICTLPVATTAQQFADGCTNPAYLLIAMDSAGFNWETIGRITQAIEKLSDAEACRYIRDTSYIKMMVEGLNAMMK